MDKINFPLVFLFVSNIIGYTLAVYNYSRRDATIEFRLKTLEEKVSKNGKDINAGLNRVRKEQATKDYHLNIQLEQIVNHLEDTGYKHVSVGRFLEPINNDDDN